MIDPTRCPRRLLATLLAVAGAMVGPAAALTTRDQNGREVDYSFLAKGTGLPQFCERIYPGATGGAGFNPAGLRTWYTRSMCYYDLAVATGNASYCDHVRPHSTLFLSGDGFNPAKCRAEVAPLKGPFTPRMDFIEAKPILMTMGYTESMIPQHFLREADEPHMWLRFLESVAVTPDFASRIGRLPDYSKLTTEENTTSCEAPYILGGQALGREPERDCCLDVNRNGLCDEAEFGKDPMNGKDLVVEASPNLPPHNLCGDRAFDVELNIRNHGSTPVRAESGYVTLLPVNPANFGLKAADFYKPLPAIPPGGRVKVRFEGLRYRDGLVERGNGMPLQAAVCLPRRGSNDCAEFIDLKVERRAVDSRECRADASLTPEVQSQWAASSARPESIRISFQKDPRPTFDEGQTFFLPVTVRNVGTTPIGGQDGFVRLERDPRLVQVTNESDLTVPLPSVAPGKQAMVIFPGLRFVPPNANTTILSGEFSATLCMRDGCSTPDRVSASLRAKDAERKLAERRARVEARSAKGWGPRVPAPMQGSDGSLTRSTLDPEALVEVGQPAPDFSSTTAEGKYFRLIQLREKTNAVLVFCPGQAAAPGCAARLASLQASQAELERLEAQVLVISEWKGEAPAAARKATPLAITWINDVGLGFSACYARRAPGEKAEPRPMLVIVDKRGKVVRALDDRGGTLPTTADLLRVLGRAQASSQAPPSKIR